MTRILACATALALLLIMPIAQAANDTPVGTWRTIDDKTGEAKSIIKIINVDGKLQGKVLKVLQSDQGPHPVCSACEGDLHNKPVEGMTILWDLEREGDSWEGGQIMDPANGKTYKCKMSLLDDGQKLEVRGFIGFSLFGRSQVWERVAEPEPAPEPEPRSVPEAQPAPAASAAAATAEPAVTEIDPAIDTTTGTTEARPMTTATDEGVQ